MTDTSYDVRIYVIDVYKGKQKTTHWVQWSVARKRFKEPFRTSALANSFRSELLSAANKGEAFDRDSGFPVSMVRKTNTTSSWFAFACSFVDMKWRDSSPGQRRTIADALTPITSALLTGTRGRPDGDVLRKAMRVAFNTSRRDARQPADVAAALVWLSQNTRPVADLAKPDVLRALLADVERKLDGTRAAPDTIRLRRITLGNALNYAVEKELLSANPLKEVTTKKRKNVAHQVDRRSVANPVQARTLLQAVPGIGRTGRKLVAFFGLMYFAALRPEEASVLRRSDLVMPPREWDQEAGRWRVTQWGDIHLAKAAPEIGAEWTDSGRRSEERGLKHREDGEGRTVPLSPDLAVLLYEHFDTFGTEPNGLLFVAERGGRIGSSTYGRVWALAREAAFTPDVVASPLAKRPYDLRHACVSTWLNAGVEAPRVAEWAGHSLNVLMRVYAKCLDGGEERARQLVQAGLGAA
ncbi:phage integrase family protein [Saccharothrix saharensis]|uniref:Phage integrase family protein n=1 Tax=Saccharothrix saharensis TaxID=571190 RepID=A0A543JI02_9PSEU|nr:tyrosine-type recombinase/integrase [Saccharothrix saharensis]TQM82436.1 phage integrase family protein [Saccharothrix saharensis]